MRGTCDRWRTHIRLARLGGREKWRQVFTVPDHRNGIAPGPGMTSD